MASAFDLATLQLRGQPMALDERVLDDEGAHFSVSDTGTFIYRRASARRFERRLVWVDPNGNVDPLPSPIRPYTDPIISPDGRYAAFTNIGAVETIWIEDLSRHSQTSLTSTTSGSSQAPVWTADGARIVYRGSRVGFRNLYSIAADGGGTEDRLTVSENMQTPTSVAGNNVAFTEAAPGTGFDVWVFALDTRKPTPFLNTSTFENSPRFSPDGHWLAYTSNVSGVLEVYVRPYPASGARLPISSGGGREPVWSRTGHELFYRHGDQMMAVRIATAPVLAAESPRKLFEGPYLASDTGGAGYDVARDGRFLMVEPLEPERPATAIDVVINWFDDVRRRVPVVNR
jgi:serine/threonine-protein kinase